MPAFRTPGRTPAISRFTSFLPRINARSLMRRIFEFESHRRKIKSTSKCSMATYPWPVYPGDHLLHQLLAAAVGWRDDPPSSQKLEKARKSCVAPHYSGRQCSRSSERQYFPVRPYLNRAVSRAVRRSHYCLKRVTRVSKIVNHICRRWLTSEWFITLISKTIVVAVAALRQINNHSCESGYSIKSDQFWKWSFMVQCNRYIIELDGLVLIMAPKLNCSDCNGVNVFPCPSCICVLTLTS